MIKESLETILTIVLFFSALYFLALGVYFMVVSMPAASIASIISGFLLLFAALYIYSLQKRK